MKKRSLLWIAALFCMISTGCGNANEESESVVYVEELPIETSQPEPVIQAETMEAEAELPQEEPYEEIEVEVIGNKGVINVGTIGAPYTELLTQARIQLAKEDWDLQIKCYDDYQKISSDVLDGTLDAHFFAHQTYIDSYNDVNKTELVGVLPVCYEAYGIYSKLNEDLTKVSGSVMGVPQDATAKARALIFMSDLEWIVLKDNVGMTAIEEDIVENTMNIQLVEYTQDTLAQVMEESDYCIVGADMAIMEGLDIKKGVIRKESPDSTSALLCATLLVTTREKESDEKVQALAAALTSQETKEYGKDTYRGAWNFIEQ